MNGPRFYGGKFFLVRTPSRWLHIHADRLEVTGSGALLCWGGHRNADKEERLPSDPEVLLAFAPGQWRWFAGCSGLTGDPVLVDEEVPDETGRG